MILHCHLQRKSCIAKVTIHRIVQKQHTVTTQLEQDSHRPQSTNIQTCGIVRFGDNDKFVDLIYSFCSRTAPSLVEIYTFGIVRLRAEK